MSEKQGKRNWTHEETTLALALYLCTPTNKIRENNPGRGLQQNADGCKHEALQSGQP